MSSLWTIAAGHEEMGSSGWFRLDIKKMFLTERAASHWNMLLREKVMAANCSEFKNHPDNTLSHTV